VGLLASLWCAVAQAQFYEPFPGTETDHRTISIQEKVDDLYTARKYERAFFIYEKELAPLGDKYAQYMVGYMYLNAQGVAQDKAQALAWYRLSAERGEPVLRKAQAKLIESMSAEEIARSNVLFTELQGSIGDTKLISDLIRQDLDTLKARTGSRIPGSSAGGPMIIIRPSGDTVGPDYYRDVRIRIEARLSYLETRVEISDIAVHMDEEALRLLQEQAKSEIAALDQP